MSRLFTFIIMKFGTKSQYVISYGHVVVHFVLYTSFYTFVQLPVISRGGDNDQYRCF